MLGRLEIGKLSVPSEEATQDRLSTGRSECGCPKWAPGDVNSSGVVNAVDISVILSAWGTNGGKFPRADTDGSGVVDAADLSVVLSGWGKCP